MGVNPNVRGGNLLLSSKTQIRLESDPCLSNVTSRGRDRYGPVCGHRWSGQRTSTLQAIPLNTTCQASLEAVPFRCAVPDDALDLPEGSTLRKLVRAVPQTKSRKITAGRSTSQTFQSIPAAVDKRAVLLRFCGPRPDEIHRACLRGNAEGQTLAAEFVPLFRNAPVKLTAAARPAGNGTNAKTPARDELPAPG